MPSETDRRGKQLPNPVTPPDTVCFTIRIPNAVQYRAAFLGQINVLGVWETWDHPTNGTDCLDCEEAAQLWRNAIYEATFSDECGGSMSCEDVADCIETDADVQEAIQQQIASQQGQTQIFETSHYGVPMTNAQASASLTAAAGCNFNFLFGSVTAITDTLNQNNVDFLEQFEIESNTIERVRDLFAAVPIFETLPVDDALAFVDTLIENIMENYNAQYTAAYRDGVRCDLFCLAKDRQDCELSFDDIQTYFEDRLGASFTPENLFLQMVEFFAAGAWTGTQIVDAITLAQVVIWRVASDFLGLSIRTLQQVGLLGANDDDPDWEILCEQCSPDWIDNNFATGSQHSWQIYIVGSIIFAEWQGDGYDRGTDTLQIAIRKPVTGTITDVEVYFNEPLSGSGGAMYAGAYDLSPLFVGSSTDQQKWVWSGLSFTDGLGLDLYRPSGFANNQKVVRVRYKLAG